MICLLLLDQVQSNRLITRDKYLLCWETPFKKKQLHDHSIEQCVLGIKGLLTYGIWHLVPWSTSHENLVLEAEVSIGSFISAFSLLHFFSLLVKPNSILFQLCSQHFSSSFSFCYKISYIDFHILMSRYVCSEGANDPLSLKHLKILHTDISIIWITTFVL